MCNEKELSRPFNHDIKQPRPHDQYSITWTKGNLFSPFFADCYARGYAVIPCSTEFQTIQQLCNRQSFALFKVVLTLTGYLFFLKYNDFYRMVCDIVERSESDFTSFVISFSQNHYIEWWGFVRRVLVLYYVQYIIMGTINEKAIHLLIHMRTE